MKAPSSLLLWLAPPTAWSGVEAFHQSLRWIQHGEAGAGSAAGAGRGSRLQADFLKKSSSSLIPSDTRGRREHGRVRFAGGWPTSRERARGGMPPVLHASADPSSAERKRSKRRKVSVKQAVGQWSEDSLELHRFQLKRVHVCKAETLPEVLSEFWSLAAECAQAKYTAMAADRDYAAHVLFVVARCDLLKDYGMMRHVDKVLDFCSGGCSDFGRTVTLQHYHPEFVLPPSGDHSEDHSCDLARMVHFSRSPYPAFGLTVAGGSATRSDPLQASDKIGRLRLDLEMVYNSVAGCSTDDSVDAHGSEHGNIPSSPKEVEEKTMRWLSSLLPEEGTPGGDGGEDEGEEGCTGYGCFLSGAREVITSSLGTPEEVLSQVWSTVTQLQNKAAPVLAAGRGPLSGAKPVVAGGGHKAATLENEGWGADGERSEPLASTLLVAPHLHPFNAAQFDNFARSLAIALKQTPIMDRIEIEVYHPELVCDGGVVDPDRRSPFPTLLIKHCGLKDQLFEPSGMYRHAVPPLKLPLDAGADADQDEGRSPPPPGTTTEVSADDAQL